MKILIAGGGYNGTIIAKYFVDEKNNEITVVDIDEKVVNKITSSMPLGGIVGNIADTKTLENADIKNMDIFIATCPNDDTNLLSCSLVTDIYHTKTKIAKVTSNRYFAHPKLYSYLHNRIDNIVVPNKHIIENLIDRITYCSPTIVDAESIESTAIKIISVKCFQDSAFIGKTVLDVVKDLQGEVSLLGVFTKQSFTLNEDYLLQAGDIIKLAVNEDDLKENTLTLKDKNHDKSPASETGSEEIVIIGDNELSVSFVKELQRYDLNRVDIVVSNLARAKKLSHELNSYGINVININLENKENLRQLNLRPNAYYFVNEAKEEDSLITCLLLKQYGINKLYTYIDSDFYYGILTQNDINHVLSPERFIIADIIPYVRPGVIHNAIVIEDGFELLYAEISDGCAYNGRPVSYVNSEGIKIIGIVEDDSLVKASDDFILKDKVRILILYSKDKLSIVESGLDAFYN